MDSSFFALERLLSNGLLQPEWRRRSMPALRSQKKSQPDDLGLAQGEGESTVFNWLL